MVWWIPLAMMAAGELSKGPERQRAIQSDLDATLNQIEQTRANQAGGQPYGAMVSAFGNRLNEREIASRDAENNVGTALQAYAGLQSGLGGGAAASAPKETFMDHVGKFSDDPYPDDYDLLKGFK